jgi:sigma-B regulation protein RsbU (phosphoserine phosphatase)
MNILVVDDDAITRLLLARYLERWGHRPTLASDGEEGWRAFESAEFSVVITDWTMPHLDGTDLVRRIRAARRAIYPYVIMLTARHGSESVAEGLDAGADDFLTKPVDTVELRARVRVAERIGSLEAELVERSARLEVANADLAVANARMRSDLDAAVAVQRSLLPAADVRVPGLACAWSFDPSDAIAGDLLNVVRLDDRHVALYVLDVSGHGVAAALRAVMVGQKLAHIGDPRAELRAKVARPEHPAPPAAVASVLAECFPYEPSTGQYFTLVFGVIDLETRELRVVSAGHPHPVLSRASGPTELLRASGYPIGLFTGLADSDYTEERVTLEPGDRVVLYSDGALGTHAGPRGETPEQQLAALVGALRGERLDRLVEAVSQGAPCAPGAESDDRSVLAIELL